MKVKSKQYKINTSKEKLFQILKNKQRSTAEFVLYHPFMKKKCEWVTGKIENDSFDLTDFRFSKTGIRFIGKVIEHDSFIELFTQINLSIFLIIFQSIWLVFFIIALFTADNFQDRLSILIIILIGETGNILIISSIIKGFYNFLESQFIKKNMLFETD